MTLRILATFASVAIGCFTLGCGAPPKPAEDPVSSDSGMPSDVSSTPAPAATEPDPSESGKLNEEQEAQMIIALKRGAEKAAQCGEVVPGSPTGEGDVEITFDGKKGRVVEAVPGAPFAGSPAEACIRRAFVGEIILPFDGDPKIVHYPVKIPEKGAKPKSGGK